MVVLRPTRKLHSVLPLQTNADAVSDTALGDWYVNRLVVDRWPLLLLVSANALLPVLIPARDVRTLPAQLASIVGGRLRRASIDPALVAREVERMAPVVVAPTCDRSVLGIMVDFAKAIPFYLVPGEWDETTLPFVESRLAETPCFAGRAREATVFPDKAAPERLRARWSSR